MDEQVVFLDNNGSSMLDDDVKAGIIGYLNKKAVIGNPSGLHGEARESSGYIEKARACIMKLFDVNVSSRVLFFSTVTEALNMTIRSMILSMEEHKSAAYFVTDHPSITRSIEYWCREYNRSVIVCNVDENYQVDTEQLESILSNCGLLAIGSVNSETGNIMQMPEICSLCDKLDIPLIVDITAEFGKRPVYTHKAVSIYCFSGHKINALPGIAAAVINNKNIEGKLSPIVLGGGQEFRLHSGTPNVLAALGLGIVLEKMLSGYDDVYYHLRALRDLFESEITTRVPSAIINGIKGSRISNVSNLCFLGIPSSSLVIMADTMGLCIGKGTSCGSLEHKKSMVLEKMGYSPDRVASSIRISFSKQNNERDVMDAVDILEKIVQKLQHQSTS